LRASKPLLTELQVFVGDVKKYLDNALSTEGVEKISSVADEARDSSHKLAEHVDSATEAIDRLVKELPPPRTK
jgi:molecular chaperone GrpE (heat shock protein)